MMRMVMRMVQIVMKKILKLVVETKGRNDVP